MAVGRRSRVWYFLFVKPSLNLNGKNIRLQTLAFINCAFSCYKRNHSVHSCLLEKTFNRGIVNVSVFVWGLWILPEGCAARKMRTQTHTESFWNHRQSICFSTLQYLGRVHNCTSPMRQYKFIYISALIIETLRKLRYLHRSVSSVHLFWLMWKCQILSLSFAIHMYARFLTCLVVHMIFCGLCRKYFHRIISSRVRSLQWSFSKTISNCVEIIVSLSRMCRVKQSHKRNLWIGVFLQFAY